MNSQGWRCPVCGRVNAPIVLECPCTAPRTIEHVVPPPPGTTIDVPPPPGWTPWCGRVVAAEFKVAFE